MTIDHAHPFQRRENASDLFRSFGAVKQEIFQLLVIEGGVNTGDAIVVSEEANVARGFHDITARDFVTWVQMETRGGSKCEGCGCTVALRG